MNACSTVAPVDAMAAAELGNALPPRSPSSTMRIFSSAHVSSPRRPPSRATPRHLINVGPAKGLDRKQIAPAWSARARVVSSGKAVMNMNGTP